MSSSHSPTALPAVLETPVGHYVTVGLYAVLSLLDVFMLNLVFQNLLGFSPNVALLISAVLMLLCAKIAFSWGRSIALNPGTSVTRHHEFFTWVFFGVVFLLTRAAMLFEDIRSASDDIATIALRETIMALILGGLYFGTGLAIRNEARKIHRPGAYDAWKAHGKSKLIQKTIAKKYARCEQLIIELERFDDRHASLKKQYDTRAQSIGAAERAAMSAVEKRLLEDNDRLTPQVMHDITSTILSDGTQKRRVATTGASRV